MRSLCYTFSLVLGTFHKIHVCTYVCITHLLYIQSLVCLQLTPLATAIVGFPFFENALDE